MIEDIYEPLSRYRDEFKDKFAENTRAKFQELLTQSEVDLEANRALNKKIAANRAELSEYQNKNSSASCFLTILIIITIAGIIALLAGAFGELAEDLKLKCILGGLISVASSLIIIFAVIVPKQNFLKQKIAELTVIISHQVEEAWRQMEPLNKLFDWHITANLIRQTVPRLEFDPYFTECRLLDLYHSFDWDDSFNNDKSVITSHSGVINDNPFVFGNLRTMEWGTETYKGTKVIHWTSRVRGSDGKMRTVHHTQTLVATYNAPKPFYRDVKLLLYGNDAAPNLRFSRNPSELSGLEDGFFNSLKKKSELKKLKKLSRNLDDDLPYTLMSNHDFEILFHATDRNDDVAFRLLFTPLAQQQMVRLLNDKEIGFGDDFSFHKLGKINAIFSDHLNNTNFNTDPQQFKFYNVDEARDFFQRFNEDFFRSSYFALAPLLSIPLYQQTRTTASIYNRQTHFKSCFWEHEAIANFYGDNYFKHPDCITKNILKTTCTHLDDGSSEIQVTAYGYRGVNRIANVKVWGNDGRIHNVQVPWIEYLPVSKTSKFYCTEKTALTEIPNAKNLITRRSILAYFK
ncbi:MAG: hypothetical protein IKD09_00875 [Lentisphaeria bacterium]|nr:hypothetical protein [Lentisphaeria bacterium]